MKGGSHFDPAELSRFDALAGEWWDPRGPFRALHVMNPLRVRYIGGALALKDAEILDVGCGGGLLAEAMARQGARVTGIDPGARAIAAAREHCEQSGVKVRYVQGALADSARQFAGRFDAVTCMELLEHVPEPAGLLRDCARVLKPGGHLVAATLNRTLPAYLFAILGAEYALGILPRGTHQYARFIRPSELGHWLRQSGFRIVDIAGVRYLPWLERCMLTGTPSINYLVHARLPGEHD